MSESERVVVTGASAGVGRAVAHRFGKAGARVALIARDAQSLAEVAREVEDAGGEAMVLPLDVADAAKVEQAARDVQAAWGGIDVWVNDAMATVFSPVAEITPEEFHRVTEVTYLGCVHGTMAALKVMRDQGGGAIVQVGSALAYRGIPLQSAYCGAKHAIRGFTDSLRCELIHDDADIRLSIVELPAVNTPQFDWARTHMAKRPRPMGRVYEPEAAADAVWRAAHGRAREYWLGRTTLMTILGNTVAPFYLDRMLARSAIAGQQTGRRVSPHRQDNLFTPVRRLHRTRGSFEGEAHRRAMLVPGGAARAGVVAAGVAVCVGIGFLAGLANRT